MKNQKSKLNKKEILSMLSAFILGVLLMLLFYPDRIAKLKNGEEVAIKIGNENITSDEMYAGLKEKYAIYEILDIVDSKILYKKYKLTDEDNKTIKEQADNYIKYYEENYNMSEEDFLKNNGFENYKDFTKKLELDFLRKKYYDEYLTKEITNDKIEEYYTNDLYAPFKVEHILVKITNEVTDEEAKEKAEEILDKLNDGEEWEDVKSGYEKDIITESFDVNFDSNLEETFKDSAIELTDGKYTKSLIKTSYGYHIIYRLETLEMPELNEVKDRIREVLKNEYATENKNVYEKSMIAMREESKLSIKDTELNKAYKNYIKDYE